MKNKTLSKKAYQLSTILIVVALVISVFSIGFYTENNSVFDNNKNIESKITGAATGMESATGMAEAPARTPATPAPAAQPQGGSARVYLDMPYSFNFLNEKTRDQYYDVYYDSGGKITSARNVDTKEVYNGQELKARITTQLGEAGKTALERESQFDIVSLTRAIIVNAKNKQSIFGDLSYVKLEEFTFNKDSDPLSLSANTDTTPVTQVAAPAAAAPAQPDSSISSRLSITIEGRDANNNEIIKKSEGGIVVYYKQDGNTVYTSADKINWQQSTLTPQFNLDRTPDALTAVINFHFPNTATIGVPATASATAPAPAAAPAAATPPTPQTSAADTSNIQVLNSMTGVDLEQLPTFIRDISGSSMAYVNYDNKLYWWDGAKNTYVESSFKTFDEITKGDAEQAKARGEPTPASAPPAAAVPAPPPAAAAAPTPGTGDKTITLDLDTTGPSNPQIKIIMGANGQFISASRQDYPWSKSVDMDYPAFRSYLYENLPALERARLIREVNDASTVPQILTGISTVELNDCFRCDSRIVVDGKETTLTDFEGNINDIERTLGLGTAPIKPLAGSTRESAATPTPPLPSADVLTAPSAADTQGATQQEVTERVVALQKAVDDARKALASETTEPVTPAPLPPPTASAPTIPAAPPSAPPRPPGESIPPAGTRERAAYDAVKSAGNKPLTVYVDPPQDRNIPINKIYGVVEGTDGAYNVVYRYKACSSCALQKYENNNWASVEYDFTIRGRDSKGVVIEPLTYKASTQQEALKKAQADLPGAALSATKSDGASLQTGGNFEQKTIDGKNFAVNQQTKTTIRIPDGADASIFVQELNDKAKIKQAYDSWLKANNYPDTKENREFFKARPPSDVNKNLINSVLEATSAKEAKAKKEATPVEKTAPDGTKYWEFQNIKYDNKDAADRAAAFKKEHPTAKLTEFKTADGKEIFLENGKYILQTTERGGQYEGEATKKEKIGGVDYEVTYSFKGKKPEPNNILFGDVLFELNSNVLSQLKSKVGKEDTLEVSEGNLVHTKTAKKTEGKEGEDSYREAATTTISTYNKDGLNNLKEDYKTINKDGNVIDKKERVTLYEYNKGNNKDEPFEIRETTYEKDENGIIDESKSMTLFTNAKTGEPITIIYSVDHPRKDKENEDLELLKAQFESRKFFAQLESVLADFSGLGYYATLFFDKEDLDIWRENVDKAFATLYLGTEYWTSGICAASTGLDRSSQGVAYIDTKTGLAAVAAHIEASRSEQLIGPGKEDNRTGIVRPTREFLYKITFNVKNGDYEKDPKALEKMRFNVMLKGERAAKLFRANIELSKGNQFGHLGRNAIVQYSDFFYDKICIEFENTPSSWTLDNGELCNTIIGPSGPVSIGQGQQQAAKQQESAAGNILDI